MSSSHRLTPLDQWPSASISDQAFNARSYERADGLRIVHLAGPNDPVSIEDTFEQSQSRIAYRVFDHEALFLGIFLGKSHRGRGMSEGLIDYFMENVGDIDGEFCGTGQINKPLIALALSRVGLKPLSSDFVVEVLPLSKYGKSWTPQVHILHNALSPQDAVVSSGPGGAFYEAIPTDEVMRRYPLGTDDRIVSLHTGYDPA